MTTALQPPPPADLRVPKWVLETGTRAKPQLKNLPLTNVHLTGHALKQNTVWANNGPRQIAFEDIVSTIRNYDLCYYTGAGFGAGEKKYQFLKRIGLKTILVSAVLTTDKAGQIEVLVPTVFDRTNQL